MRIPVIVLLVTVALASCRAPAPRDPADVFAVEGADLALHPASETERAAITTTVADLNRLYGYEPDGTLRDLCYLRDLFDRGPLRGRLLAPPVATLAPALADLGYRFRPDDAEILAAAPAGPAGALLADASVLGFLRGLRTAGLLDGEAARDLLGLSAARAEELRLLAADPEATERVRREAARFPFRFRPSDARELSATAVPLPAGTETFLVPLLAGLSADYRPRYRPELAEIAAHEEETLAFVKLASESAIPLTGPPAVLALARLVRDHRPPEGEERERFEKLATLLLWPDAGDMPGLSLLAADPLAPAVIEELADRYGYRLRSSDARDLLLLARAPRLEPALPDWIVRDRPPLTRPGFLLSDRPAEAFAGPNDLRFMERIAALRPELARKSRDALEREVRERLRPFAVRFRVGAPYTETAEDLSAYLTPDLIKILLTLDALARPGEASRIGTWIREDILDTGTEFGGYVRLDPDGGLRFELFTGAVPSRDDRLELPPDPEGAALEFHFHATDEDDADFAGPSSGGPGTDLFRAARRRIDGVVFTSLPGGRFDADFYTDSGLVMDLGTRDGRPGRWNESATVPALLR